MPTPTLVSKFGDNGIPVGSPGGADYAYPQATAVPSNPSGTNPTLATPAAKAYMGGLSSNSTTSNSVTLPSGMTGTKDAQGNFTPDGNSSGTSYSSTVGSNTGAPATPPVSSAPASDPTTAYRSAMDEYLNYLKPSAEETGAKDTLNRLTLQSKKDYEDALGRGETLGFASGEAARVQRNNSFGIDAASNALNAYTSNREALTGATKARLDFEKGLYDDNKTANPAFELSPGQERYSYNNSTGKYEKVASSPKDTSFSLSQGATRYDAQGNPIANNPKTATPKAPSSTTPKSSVTNSSATTQSILKGLTTLSALTPAKKTAVTNELNTLGIGQKNAPDWFRQMAEAEWNTQTKSAGATSNIPLSADILQRNWLAYQNKILGGATTPKSKTSSTSTSKRTL